MIRIAKQTTSATKAFVRAPTKKAFVGATGSSIEAATATTHVHDLVKDDKGYNAMNRLFALIIMLGATAVHSETEQFKLNVAFDMGYNSIAANCNYPNRKAKLEEVALPLVECLQDKHGSEICKGAVSLSKAYEGQPLRATLEVTKITKRNTKATYYLDASFGSPASKHHAHELRVHLENAQLVYPLYLDGPDIDAGDFSYCPLLVLEPTVIDPPVLETSTWSRHCKLPKHPDYNMYSDDNPDDRYIDNSEGTITDLCTGLTWEQNPSLDNRFRWEKAKDYCTTLNKGGVNDWRAPTIIELQTLVDYTRRNPAHNNLFAKGSWVWSGSQLYGSQYIEAWIINLADGNTSWVSDDADIFPVHCVRGAGREDFSAGMNYYTVTEFTVTDNYTKEEWQRIGSVKKFNWSAAQTYCRDLVLGGQDDWRLPTVRELSMLVDLRARMPAIDVNAFPVTPSDFFWSSSVLAGSGGKDAWSVNFAHGIVADINVLEDMYVRCVRN